jgi:hypothetical protein
MRMLAYLLAIIAAIAAVMYYTMPAGSLPTFMPGYAAGSDHVHMTPAVASSIGAEQVARDLIRSAVGAVLLFIICCVLGPC